MRLEGFPFLKIVKTNNLFCSSNLTMFALPIYMYIFYVRVRVCACVCVQCSHNANVSNEFALVSTIGEIMTDGKTTHPGSRK